MLLAVILRTRQKNDKITEIFTDTTASISVYLRNEELHENLDVRGCPEGKERGKFNVEDLTLYQRNKGIIFRVLTIFMCDENDRYGCRNFRRDGDMFMLCPINLNTRRRAGSASRKKRTLVPKKEKCKNSDMTDRTNKEIVEEHTYTDTMAHRLVHR